MVDRVEEGTRQTPEEEEDTVAVLLCWQTGLQKLVLLIKLRGGVHPPLLEGRRTWTLLPGPYLNYCCIALISKRLVAAFRIALLSLHAKCL